ncbi:nuclear transport factor 2 family protein [Reichenbachiella versicolor]|uniref:nuclear transport factor 2 family protein n=1 Tax=Reichenbachiella versicolor TaxID=1821036 RepID=UPI000D6E57F1|nr:nuclear transport factor 2 family protein [Reichenbachiella versicolor]
MSYLDTVKRFYSAFNERDSEVMNSCYHEDVRFTDPVFQHLDYNETKAMWSMLVSRATDLTVELVSCKEQGNIVVANWEAIYTFSKTGRKVHNRIEATLRFEDELIIDHVDRFDIYNWCKMAFGFLGLILGWTSKFQNKVRVMAEKSLNSYMSKT